MSAPATHPGYVSVTPLLKKLAAFTLTGVLEASPKEIAAAVTLVFDDRISPIQFSLLLWALHTTSTDHNPEVLASTARYMRSAAAQVDQVALRSAVSARAKPEGNYHGGLVSPGTERSTTVLYSNIILRLTLSVLAAMVTTPSTSRPHHQSWRAPSS